MDTPHNGSHRALRDRPVSESAVYYKYNGDLDFVLKSARHVSQCGEAVQYYMTKL
jgi:hypothetical protein